MEKHTLLAEVLKKKYTDETELAQVFCDIEKELEKESRVVCQYIVNGLELSEVDEARLGRIKVGEVQTLEYKSQHLETLLHDVVLGWLQALPELQEKVDRWAERLQNSQPVGALRDLYHLVENCEYLTVSLKTLSDLMGHEYDQKFTALAPLDFKTKECLREAIRHLRSKDFMQLALILEYDLNHCLEQWSELLRGLINAEHISQVDQRGITH